MVKEELVKLTGDVVSAIVLNQMIYWSEIIKESNSNLQKKIKAYEAVGGDTTDLVNKIRDGWIWKTADDMLEEIMFSSRPTVSRKMNELVKAGFLDTRKNPNHKWDRTNQYRVNFNFIQGELNKIGYSLDGYALNTETSNPSNSQIDQWEETPVKSNSQNEQSITQNEQSVAHSEQAIPEITTETTNKRLHNNNNMAKNKHQEKIGKNVVVVVNAWKKFFPNNKPLTDREIKQIVELAEGNINWILETIKNIHHSKARNPKGALKYAVENGGWEDTSTNQYLQFNGLPKSIQSAVKRRKENVEEDWEIDSEAEAQIAREIEEMNRAFAERKQQRE